jgi:hypothetical protein
LLLVLILIFLNSNSKNKSKNDCISFEPILNLNCAGKRNCYVPFTKQRLPECNYRTSEYIQIEYDCIPSESLFSFKSKKICINVKIFKR